MVQGNCRVKAGQPDAGTLVRPLCIKSPLISGWVWLLLWSCLEMLWALVSGAHNRRQMLGFTAQECVDVNKTWGQKLGGPKPVQGHPIT